MAVQKNHLNSSVFIFAKLLYPIKMKKPIIQIAVVMAAVSILLFLTQTIYIGGWLYFSVLGLIAIALSIIVPVYVLRQYRKGQQDRLTFGEAFMIAFFGVALGSLVATVFQVFYTSVVDPDFPGRVAMATVEMTHGFVAGQIDDEALDTILREAEKDALERYTLLGALKGFGIGMIIMAVIALIIAAVMKRQPESAFNKDIIDA